MRRPVACVLVVPEGGLGEGAVDLAATHGATDDEVVRAPAVVRAVVVRCERATKIRRGEERHLPVEPELHHGLVEGRDAEVEAPLEHGQASRLVRVRVEAADADEEDLAAGAERLARLDGARDGSELSAEAIRREEGRESRDALRRRVIAGVGVEAGPRHGGQITLEKMRARRALAAELGPKRRLECGVIVGLERLDDGRASRADRVGHRAPAREEELRVPGGDAAELRRGVPVAERIEKEPAPAVLRALRPAAHPGGLLVVVGEEAGGSRDEFVHDRATPAWSWAPSSVPTFAEQPRRLTRLEQPVEAGRAPRAKPMRPRGGR